MIFMFLVLLMGALVTKTESGRGCGDDWPLCNGKFVPAYTIESMIEYSHRFVAGLAGMLMLAVFVLVFLTNARKEVKWYASGGLFFTILQAILGAMAVVWPQSSPVLALHFGFSLLAFSLTLLLALAYTKSGSSSQKTVMSSGLRMGIWLTTLYCYGVVYLGAFVRHTKSSGGCLGWPLCNGQVIPELSGETGIVFAHRLAAIGMLILVILLLATVSKTYKRTDSVYKWSQWSLIFVVLQILSGALVTYTMGYDSYLLASLLHTLLVSCLFGMLSYLTVLAIRAKQTEVAGVRAAERS
ncbi:COX15/CtaA family protein [Paenibacillus thalictri]|nr:COX15/CtaA family protein [Paenibacillus thalictri]